MHDVNHMCMRLTRAAQINETDDIIAQLVQKERRRAQELGASWARTDAGQTEDGAQHAADSEDACDGEEMEEIFTAGAKRAKEEAAAADGDAEADADTSHTLRLQRSIHKHAIADAANRSLRALVVLFSVYFFTAAASHPLASSAQSHAGAPGWMSIFWVLLADFVAQSVIALALAPWPTFPPGKSWLLILEAVLRYATGCPCLCVCIISWPCIAFSGCCA